MNSRRQNKKKKKNTNNNKSVIPRPTEIPDYAITCRKRLRFVVVTNLTNSNVTWNNLVDTIGFCATATAGYNLFRAVKLNFVEVWDCSSNQGTINSISLDWAESDTNLMGGRRTISSTSLGIEPAHFKAKPPKNSLTADWYIGAGPNTVVAFSLTCSASSIVDVDLSFRSSTTGASNGENVAQVGGVVGAIFWRGLDGIAAAGSKYSIPAGIYQL